MDISIHALREEGDQRWQCVSVDGLGFLSTPSARRATPARARLQLPAQISIHALREEGDLDSDIAQIIYKISIHALREEGDTVPSSETTSVEDFYPRPPRGGRLQPVFQGENCCLNFYPRPPRGGRPINLGSGAMRGDFYPRPPRGGRRRAENVVTADTLFLSTPSARRATPTPPPGAANRLISIHALREEGDLYALSDMEDAYAISIHALREEGDPPSPPLRPMQAHFYPRPPRGGRHLTLPR